MDMYSMVIVFNLSLVFLAANHLLILACDEICPADKPYCSNAGCISECPEPFYINGSECVWDCGRQFVTVNRTCVDSCPNNTYSKETLRQVHNTQYLERKCIVCSNFDEYIMNETCVHQCPEKWRNIDQQKCATECPAARPFKLLKTISNLIHFVCVNECPILEDNGVCTDTCSENKVKLESSCVYSCPSSDPILLSNECISECPSAATSSGSLNSTCIYQCHDDKPFVSYNSCVSACPENAKLKLHRNGVTFCTEKCEDGEYMYTDDCLEKCPVSTVAVNNSCVNSCPAYRSLTCMVKKGKKCGSGQKDNLDHAVCVDVCPDNMFISNQSCVYACPDGTSIFNNECVDMCPVDYPYIHNSTITDGCTTYSGCAEVRYVLKCTDKCPKNTYFYGKLCVLYCPENTIYNNDTCVEQCPYPNKYLQNSSITITSWVQSKSWSKRFNSEKQLIYIQKCVASCPREMFKLNFTCFSSCPSAYRFVRNKTCTTTSCDTPFMYSNISGIFCTENCKTFDFKLNSTCVESCPDTYIVLNDSCVEKCPPNHPYSSKSVLGKKCVFSSECSAVKEATICVSKCPQNTYIYNMKCLMFCPEPLFTHQGECVLSCPVSSKLIDTSVIAVSKLTLNTHSHRLHTRKTNVSISECVRACPANKAAVKMKCIDMCPAHSRFIYDGFCTNEPCNTTFVFRSSAGIVCTNTCNLNQFEYKKTCLIQCPDGYFPLENRCVAECNMKGQIVNNETIAFSSHRCTYGSQRTCVTKFLYDIQCRHDCPRKRFLWNNNCLDICPSDTITFNKTCITNCPETHMYINQKYVKMKVWHFSIYLESYTEIEIEKTVKECVVKCPKFRSGKICVDHCPVSRTYSAGDSCVTSCPEGTLADLRGHNCIENCPDDMIKQGHTCRIRCGSNLLYKDGKCVESYECKDPSFEFAGQCVNICPDGYVWFTSCFDLLVIGLCIPVLLIPTMGLVVFGRSNFIDILTILWLVFSKEDTSTKYLTKKQVKQPIKAINKTARREEEVLLLEDIDNSDDDMSLFARTRHNTNDDLEIESVL